jgi:alpha/beta superfamily hydrolase
MRIETVPITTLDGLLLEGDLAVPPGAKAHAVLCHPHPLHGGDRHNGVIEALFGALPGAGVNTLRFDFRGVNDSEGTHDEGDGERLDVAAALELLVSFDPDLPAWLVGYSFGSLVALDVVHPQVHGWVAIAPPLTMARTSRLAGSDHRPKRVIVARHDQFCPPEIVDPVTATWSNTVSQVVESADHFLAGRTAAVADLVVRAIVG